MTQQVFPSPSWQFKQTIGGFETQSKPYVSQFFGAPLPPPSPNVARVEAHGKFKNNGFKKPFGRTKKNTSNFQNCQKKRGLYNCDTCDKPFDNLGAFETHVNQHETCGQEGCQFTAHPNIVAKHVTMQHKSGLFKRMGKIYSQEEITKWIQERKRCYPSRQRIEEKKQQDDVKMERGERLEEDKRRFNNSFSRGESRTRGSRCHGRKRRHPRKNYRGADKHNVGETRNPIKRRRKEEDEEEENVDDCISRSRLPQFSGIGSENVINTTDDRSIEDEAPKKDKDVDNRVVASDVDLNNSIGNQLLTKQSSNTRNAAEDDLVCSDEEWTTEAANSNRIHVPKVTICQSLLLLQNCYGSDSEAEPEDTPSTRNHNTPARQVASVAPHGDESPLEVKTKTSHINDSELESAENRFQRSKRPQRHTQNNKFGIPKGLKDTSKCYKKKTLLEDLLKTEIRHERNVILQCVHHIVENNFFDK